MTSRTRSRTAGALQRLQPPPANVNTAESLRDVILARAGIDLEEQASIVRRSVDTMKVALDAMSVTVPEMPDFYARIKAAHGLLSLVGAFPSRTTNTHGTPQVSINIELPDWAQPMMHRRSVTPLGESDKEVGKT